MIVERAEIREEDLPVVAMLLRNVASELRYNGPREAQNGTALAVDALNAQRAKSPPEIAAKLDEVIEAERRRGEQLQRATRAAAGILEGIAAGLAELPAPQKVDG